jgi:hypothetical protein
MQQALKGVFQRAVMAYSKRPISAMHRVSRGRVLRSVRRVRTGTPSVWE